ncbi:epoxyqueuosine reductase QueH [Porphyromonas circumdentaria]|uniref:Epoxyqueuosine reductase QueH n=1 Tax=Porphyromonas circumdentaria TaxID=29524 RepID=A0A1T4KQL9_9PORP|nr:epoxyqueuosine reductase QueH [Porphyromonas circumdentaria]MBB6274944.1 hypothetical protein [Porphyromonas circumdentaria]MDO4722223.1 epoxyqueuosine reductase QueH [Porphyromonas circumdentaria]SJZ44701.1 hypothetical protein SAMN02745171_00148 [Porphyromonas circumdentaria]
MYDFSKIEIPEGAQQVVLHTCCAPCSSAIIKALQSRGVRVIVFFYNPNIHPIEEYNRRKAEIVRYAQSNDIPFFDGDYDAEQWFEHIKGYEEAPERGERCARCFELRLMKTAAFAQAMGVRYFATTLASSRWKSLTQIEAAGRKAESTFEGTCFWHRNWRKDGLQELRQQIILQEGFYNQTYCGCVFSQESGERKKRQQ